MAIYHKPSLEVYINCHGSDCRSFLSHLEMALKRKGVNVHVDEDMEMGKYFGESLKMIEQSRVALVILSSRYTESSNCLNALVKIKQRVMEDKLVAIPIFYKLKKSQVKRLEGDFGLKLWNHVKMTSECENLKLWMEALHFVSSQMGFTLTTNSDEFEFITRIINAVKNGLTWIPLDQIEKSSNELKDAFMDDSFSSAEKLNRVDDDLNPRKDECFLGEAKSDATPNLGNIIENKVEPMKEEITPEQVIKSSKNRKTPLDQVFINFLEEELRFSFASHLVSALLRKGINVYTYNNEKRGEEVLGKRLERIDDSKIAIVIFSSRYTESKWCLEELVKIKERMEEGKLHVIPIFYKVEPSTVKQINGDFGGKLWKLWRINRDHRIVKWKEALESIASLPVTKEFCSKEHSSESMFVTTIVNEVHKVIEIPHFYVPMGRGKKPETFPYKCLLFGIEQRVEQLEQKLEFECNKTRIIGVVGLPGIGKTTLVTKLHEKWNSKFIHCVPLLDIRKKSEDYGLVWLRTTLLEVLLRGECPIINDKTTHESMKNELLETKVLVVLDDVSDTKQLEVLLGNLKWIKNGSKIVITTSDKSLLEGWTHDTYVVSQMDDKEAFQLFSYYAFDDQNFSPLGTLLLLSRMFVDFAGGNPLALKLIGNELRGQDEAQWEYKLQNIRQGLNTKIQDIWRFYTDKLTERQKDVFLDIVYFFKSEDEYFVRSILDSGDLKSTNTVSEVTDLTNKFFITNSCGRVDMKDLVHAIGNQLGSLGRYKLWSYNYIINKLTNMKKTEANIVRGIFIDMSEVTRNIALEHTTFVNMCSLRYLKIYNSCCPRKCDASCKLYFPDGLDFPLEEVRYLHWLKFPLKELPSSFRPKNLIDLRLPYSKIDRVWEGVKDTPQLKWVDLSYSSKLLSVSALLKAENLQRLDLEGCTNLEELPLEIQNMNSLIFLNLRGCIRLYSLPKVNLASLKTLILSDCSNLKEFQLISECVEFLHLDGTAIKELPTTIQKVKRLVVLNLKNCVMLEFLPNCLGNLKVLEKLILSGCSMLKNFPDVRHNMKHLQMLLFDNTRAKEMPKVSNFTSSKGQASADIFTQPLGSYCNLPRGVDRVSLLQHLCLSGNDFITLETEILELYNLKWLDVQHCKNLRSVPMLPPNLQYFDAHGCVSLERVANPLSLFVRTEQIHATFNFSYCNMLDLNSKDSIISYIWRKSQLVLDALSRYDGGNASETFIGTCFPGWEVPTQFSHRASGSMLKPKLPPYWCDNRFTGIALCAVILISGFYDQKTRLIVKCNCEFKNQDGSSIRFTCTVGGWSEPDDTPRTIESSHVFTGYTSRLDINKHGLENEEEGCICTEASLEFQVTDGTENVVGCEVIKCGFSLVYASDGWENISSAAKTIKIQKRTMSVPGVASSHGNSQVDDDIQYKPDFGLTLGNDEKEKSDASFENKSDDLSNEAREKITVNLEKPKMLSFPGVELRIKQLENLLYSTPGNTRIVGVVGMPGIGKTTLATILFDKRGCKFPSNLFLKVSKEYRLEELRRMLLKALLKHKNEKISYETTHESMKEKLVQTKCFVVLDDVSGKKQLEFLLGNLNWIKKGSKIVITTCDMSLLEGLAHDTYLVPKLNNIEAFNLFKYHAFDGQICNPTGILLMLSKMMVDIARGNPLALALLGNELRGKDKTHWEHKLLTMTQSSNTNIEEILISDQLTERQKDAFLDILCFFISEDEYFVRSLLDSGDLDSNNASSEVTVLAEKFLITISDGRVKMNDLLSSFDKNLGFIGRHRLWNYHDIFGKLKKMPKKEANNARGIFLDMSKLTKNITLEPTTFINMHNLRYLNIYNSCCPQCKLYFPDGFDLPLEEVRYLHWLKFPLDILPSNFRPHNLVGLKMPYSKIKYLWEGVKDTPRLKWVDLSHSSKLLNVSTLSKATNLQRLDLEGCTNLNELPLEFQNMKFLIFLNLRGCIRLGSLPQVNLASLKTLILSDCSNFREFQLIAVNLEFLHLDGTAIKGLRTSIRNLGGLVILNLKNCKMLEFLPNGLDQLKSLEELILSGCSRLKNLPDFKSSMKHLRILLFDRTGAVEMPNMSSFTSFEGQASPDMFLHPRGSYVRTMCGVNGVSLLQRLCLSENDFVSLQNDIMQLSHLKWLDVKHCKKLRSIPMLPPRLEYFNAHGCDSLERVANPLALPLQIEHIHATFNFTNCNKLNQDAKDSIITYCQWKNLLVLDALSRYNLGTSLEALTGTCFPGWEIPAWFSHHAFGSVLDPKLSPHWCNNRFIGINLCAVIKFPEYCDHSNVSVKCSWVSKNQDGSRIHASCTIGGWSDQNHTPLKLNSSHVFIGYLSRLDINKHGRQDDSDQEGCIFTETNFEFQVSDGCEVLKCGLNLVYADERDNQCWDAKTVGTENVPSEVSEVTGKSSSYTDIIYHHSSPMTTTKSYGKLEKSDKRVDFIDEVQSRRNVSSSDPSCIIS